MVMSSAVGRSLGDRVNALAAAVGLARGKAPDAVVNAADEVVARARRLAGHGTGHTVVALVGPAGSGKSSLVNALAGAELADVDVTPAADRVHACVWGPGGDDLLDSLEIELRHHVDPTPELLGLVLLELPDPRGGHIDPSIVSQLIDIADVTVWVFDPDSYADREFRNRYIGPRARGGEAMRFLINKSDRVDHVDGISGATGELRALVGGDGIADAVVLACSTQTAGGLDDARAMLAEVVAARRRSLVDLEAQLRDAAESLRFAGGSAGMGSSVRGELIERLGSAIGLTVAGEIASRQHLHDGIAATGWPPVRAYRRHFPDRSAHLAHATHDVVILSEVDAALRAAGDRCAEGLPDPWDRLVREAATRHFDDVVDALDRVSLRTSRVHKRRPEWWRWVGWLQRLLWVATLLGVGWLVIAGVLELLGADGGAVAPTTGPAGLPLPGLVVTVCVLGGVLLALGSWLRIRRHAQHRARRTRGHLRRGVADIAQSEVVQPIDSVLADHSQLLRLLAQVAPAEHVVRRRKRGVTPA